MSETNRSMKKIFDNVLFIIVPKDDFSLLIMLQRNTGRMNPL